MHKQWQTVTTSKAKLKIAFVCLFCLFSLATEWREKWMNKKKQVKIRKKTTHNGNNWL